MANGKTGYFDIGGTLGFKGRVNYSEEYSIDSNTSVVSVDPKIFSQYYAGKYFLEGSVSVNGKAVMSCTYSGQTHFVNTNYATGEYLTIQVQKGAAAPPWPSVAIQHDNEGNATTEISVSLRGFRQGGGVGNGFSVTGSQRVQLATIPRASTIGASDANIGSTSIIAVNRKSQNFTHSIRYQFGNLSGYVTAEGGASDTEQKYTNTSIPFRIPDSWYSQIPNAKSGLCTLTCRTYLGSSQIGTDQKTEFRAIASIDLCRPDVDGKVTDINDLSVSLTGDSGKLIRYVSTAYAEVFATPKNSASISKMYVNGGEVPRGFVTMSKVEIGDFTFSATDTRGYSASANKSVNIVPYIILTSNPNAYRTDPTSGNAKIEFQGSYFAGSFGATNNTLAITYQYGKTGGSLGNPIAVSDIQTAEGKYSALVSLSGIDYRSSYNLKITVSDKIETVVNDLVIRQGIPLMDWGEHDITAHVPFIVREKPQIPAEAVSKAFAETKIYNCWGEMLDGVDNPITASGSASVTISSNIARIDFTIKVETVGTDGYVYGLNPNLLKKLNNNIPNIEPITGGTILVFSGSDAAIDTSVTGYGGLMNASYGLWRPSRIYTPSGSEGVWTAYIFDPGDYISGVCFGRVIE